MPKLHEHLGETCERGMCPAQLAAFIKRMEGISEGEARLVRFLEEDMRVGEQLIGFRIAAKPRD